MGVTTVVVLMDGPHAVNAIYANQVVLTVTSTVPSGVFINPVTPADNFGLSFGTAPFLRSYDAGTTVTLTAPPTGPGGVAFLKWQRDGVDFTTSRTAVVAMDINHVLNAVYTAGGTPTPKSNSLRPTSSARE